MADGSRPPKIMRSSIIVLIVESCAEKLSVTLDDFIYILGSPGVEPDVPAIASPDRIALDQAAVNFETRKRMCP
ncbi:MAG: hypothetical protein M0Z56_05150 [Desulfobacteraceae bacterium]|nr:hypothetical protein [Desulfobacteraceae bacterium]